jgi:hypothetical protein
MNSALVIGLFIQHSYKRQTEKQRDSRRFMVLTETERSYFLDGIAAYMAGYGLQNQVTREQFDNAIANLYRVIPKPEELSASVSALSRDEARPLNERLQDREDPLEAVKTDVRTYGILVQDFSRRNALRFPHKSFFEYLFANYVVRRLTGCDKVVSSAIWTATEAAPEKIIDMPESLSLAGELMGGSNGISTNSLEKSKLLKTLFNTIVRYPIPRVVTPFLYLKMFYSSGENNPNSFIRALFRHGFPLVASAAITIASFFHSRLMSTSHGVLSIVIFLIFIGLLLLLMSNTLFPIKRMVLWFIIAVSLGVRKKHVERAYGKLIAEGLPELARNYGAGDILDKLQYEKVPQ